MDGINTVLDIAEERLMDLNSTDKKIFKKWEKRSSEQWNMIKQSNMYIIGVPEWLTRNGERNSGGRKNIWRNND